MGVDDVSEIFFQYLNDVAMQPILWQNYLPPCTYRPAIQKRNGIMPCICIIKYHTNASISCKILVKIGPAVSAENILIDVICAATRLQFDDRRPFDGNY